jgi:hypothetical protein
VLLTQFLFKRIQDPVIKRCSAKYTSAQLTAMQNMAAEVFSFKCFTQLLEEACTTYVESTYIAPLRNVQI